MLEKLRDLKNELVLAPHFWRLGLINISFSLDRFVPSVMLLRRRRRLLCWTTTSGGGAAGSQQSRGADFTPIVAQRLIWIASGRGDLARAVAPQHFHNRPRQDGQRGVQDGRQEEGRGTQQNADVWSFSNNHMRILFGSSVQHHQHDQYLLMISLQKDTANGHDSLWWP